MKKIVISVATMALLLAACGNQTQGATKSTENKVKTSQVQQETNQTKGETMARILASTNWQGTKVYDATKQDLTKENGNFIGLAKYDGATGQYEFFDATTGKSRGDEGTFFFTNDGKKRILISQTMKYQAVVDIVELSKETFTYKRVGKDKDGKEVEVFVEHKPYNAKQLSFTNTKKEQTQDTASIYAKVSGSTILGKTLWNGTRVIDEKGNDVTKANQNLISLAKFDGTSSKYEFFQLETGESRGDFGYFDVLNHNHERAHVSIGKNKYGAVLALTELTAQKFTYTRMGKDDEGKEIKIFVEHKPYKGTFNPTFTF